MCLFFMSDGVLREVLSWCVGFFVKYFLPWSRGIGFGNHLNKYKPNTRHHDELNIIPYATATRYFKKSQATRARYASWTQSTTDGEEKYCHI